ncbi:MAG: MFS transporter [Bauldia sp.]|nr:MFS transporter [Bauldia sp.]
MDLTVLNLALPAIAADLEPDAIELLWMVDIYGFLTAGFLILMGTLGDRIGRRRLLLIGSAAFALASLAAAFSTSAGMMIAARAAQGVAAATLAPSTLSLIRNMFLDDRQRTFAIGVWIACFSAGAALGPVVGGLLLSQFWWGSVFLINVPLMLSLLVIGPLFLPEYRDAEAGRLDLVSAVMSLAAVLLVIYGIKHAAEHGVDGVTLGAAAAGVLVGAGFLYRQRLLREPLLDLILFRRAAFAVPLAINVLKILVFVGIFFLVAQYLQLVLGFDALTAGLWIAPTGLVMIAASLAAPTLIRLVPPAPAIAAAFTVVTVSLILIATADGSFVRFYIGILLLPLGTAPVGTLTTDLVISSVPPRRAGMASGISETSFEFGGAIGIAILGSLSAAVYRTAMAGYPLDVPPATANAARTTLAAAVETAATLPGPAGAALLARARDAFVAGFETAAWIGAIIAIFIALLALTTMRGVKRPAAAH